MHMIPDVVWPRFDSESLGLVSNVSISRECYSRHVAVLLRTCRWRQVGLW
jgi:hypothetical protein